MLRKQKDQNGMALHPQPTLFVPHFIKSPPLLRSSAQALRVACLVVEFPQQK
jgi:hypothetical protein